MHERLVLVGERRSKTAQEKDYSWQKCQETGCPKLSAIRLFDALSEIGFKPEDQIFINLWNDDETLNETAPTFLKEMLERGEKVVAMGNKVDAELNALGIKHKKIIHPAARGKNAGKTLYRLHIKEVLVGEEDVF